ncbi:MAG: DUF2505 domain-containing protein, partial [Nannocystaceae bacterium]
DTSLDRYWEMFFDDDYNRELYRALDIDRTVLKVEPDGDVTRREVLLKPQREIPKLFKKIMKGSLEYTEHNVFDRGRSLLEVRIVPAFGADKITNVGTYRVVDLGSNRVRRIYEGECKCKIPLVGGKVEKHIVGEIRASYVTTTDVSRKWLREHA